MSSPAYENYKSSGAEWLGDVPSHWEILRIANVFREVSMPGCDELPVLSVSIHHGVSDSELNDAELDRKVTRSDDRSKYKRVEPGDLVYNMMRAWQGGFGTVQVDGMVSPAYVVARPFRAIETEYLEHLLRTPQAIEQMRRHSRGITDFRLRLYWEEFKNICISLPPPEEQTAIAEFLDRETAKIDDLIAEQKRLIELLKEKRKAVISHAVTKGLNPDAPMKDSGIEWLGEVPEHWEVLSVSRISCKITNGYVGPTRDILVETGVPYIQATHIKRGRINFDGAYFVTQEWSEKHSKSILANGDVLIVQTGAGTGDVGLVSEDEAGFNCHALIIVQCSQGTMTGQFLAAMLQSEYGVQTLESIQTGGMHPHLNCGNVKFVDVPVPPTKEQDEIVSYINETVVKCDCLMEESQTAMELLQERRTALISAAVTGKIDVREFATVGSV